MHRIVIRATNWIGDAVMSLPALQAVRERAPQAHIAVLAKPGVGDLYAREGFEIIPYLTRRQAIKDLRARRFDTAILLQNAFDAAFVAWLARIPRRIGYNRDARGWLLTDAIPVPEPHEIPPHQRFYYLELLRRAGIIETLPACESIRLTRGAVRSDVIGISPGAAYGKAKQWLPDRFAEAAAIIGGDVALFGSKDDRAVCDQIATILESRGVRVHNYAGQTTVREYIDLAATCRVYLTNDSGGMHIASALGVPTVAIFGATDHEATGPTGERARIVREPVACSPCLLRECPIDHRCMTAVTAERVAAEANRLLNSS
jgi:heptosyltransferase-2